jgi:hypothetical protein
MSILNPILFTLWASLLATTQQGGKADVVDPPLEEYPISIAIKRFYLLWL